MNTCPGCNERVSPGEEECSHCGTPLAAGSSSASNPVLAGRKTFIAGAGELRGSAAAVPAGAGSGRKTRIEGGAAAPAAPASDEDLYVPRGRRPAPAQRLDPKDPFARAVVAGDGSDAAPSDDPGQSPSKAPGRRRKTHFWNADPDTKPTLVGDSAAPASDPWASALSDPPPPSEAGVALGAPDALAGLLVSFSLDTAGTVHPIRRGKTAIGRSGDPGLDVELDDGKVSSPHCMIIARPSGVFLQDSMSTNGTWFRRGELTEFEDIQTTLNNSARLEDGDFFRVGNSVFLVRLIDPGFVQRIWGD